MDANSSAAVGNQQSQSHYSNSSSFFFSLWHTVIHKKSKPVERERERERTKNGPPTGPTRRRCATTRGPVGPPDQRTHRIVDYSLVFHPNEAAHTHTHTHTQQITKNNANRRLGSISSVTDRHLTRNKKKTQKNNQVLMSSSQHRIKGIVRTIIVRSED